MAGGVTAQAVLWLTSIILVIEAARPNNATCPTGCDCSESNTLRCNSARSFPTVEGNDLVNFFFTACRFSVDLSTVPYVNAQLLFLDNCAVTPSIGPESLGHLKGLRWLTITGNRHLQEVHRQAFANLTELETLELTANNVSGLPAGLFSGLERLTFVDLSGNPELGRLPAELFGSATSGITGFVCNDCGLTDIPTDLLAHTPHLNRLELNKNNLTSLGARMFADLPSLEQLAIDNSRLRKIDAAAFSGLETSLKELRLGHNRITTISATTIRGLGKLRHLELDGNSLTGIAKDSLPASLFDSGSPPAVLKLGHNPWFCQCDLLWLRQLSVTDSDEMTCSLPTTVKDRPFYGVEELTFCAVESGTGGKQSSTTSSYAVAAILCSSLGLAALGLAVLYYYCSRRRLRASPARYANGAYYASPASSSDKA